MVALAGCLALHALQRFTEGTQEAAHADGRAGGRSEEVPRAGTDTRRIFWMHLRSFLVYNAIIAYTLPLNYGTSTGLRRPH